MQVLGPSEIANICNYIGIRHDVKKYDYWADSGTDAMFFPVNEYSGFKIFHNPKVAKQSYYYSRIFATLGFTPKAWDLGSVTISGKEIWYYFTELAEPYDGPDLVHDYYNSDDEDEFVPHNEVQDHNEEMFEMTGFKNDDPHSGNYGYISGRLVCIDVGHIIYHNYENDLYVMPKWD